jgi:hypothetical protein
METSSPAIGHRRYPVAQRRTIDHHALTISICGSRYSGSESQNLLTTTCTISAGGYAAVDRPPGLELI